MKPIEEIKIKIQKLFAMADPESGASKSEVETALKKARKLLIDYKLTEADLSGDSKNDNVVSKSLDDITFSATTDMWILQLLHIIGKHYPVHPVSYKSYNAKTRTAGFIGLEADVEIAEAVMRYAISCIQAECKRITSKARKCGYSYHEITGMKNAYGLGYCTGINETFEKQNLEEMEGSSCTALVMQTPQIVEDYVSEHCSTNKVHNQSARDNANKYGHYQAKGYVDGKNFDMKTKLVG